MQVVLVLAKIEKFTRSFEGMHERLSKKLMNLKSLWKLILNIKSDIKLIFEGGRI